MEDKYYSGAGVDGRKEGRVLWRSIKGDRLRNKNRHERKGSEWAALESALRVVSVFARGKNERR